MTVLASLEVFHFARISTAGLQWARPFLHTQPKHLGLQTPPNPPRPAATPKLRLLWEGSLSHFSFAAVCTLTCSTAVSPAAASAHEGRGLGYSAPHSSHTHWPRACVTEADILALHDVCFIIIILHVHVCESQIEPYYVTGNVLLALRV